MVDNNNRCYHNSKGEEIPRVSDVVKMINKPELIQWANRMGFRHIKAEEYVNERALIGTDFHALVATYMEGKDTRGIWRKEALEMLNRFKIWAKCHNYKVLSSEITLEGEEFGGTFDALAEIDGNLILVDYKTSKKIYHTQFIQLAGYLVLIKELMPNTYKRLKGAAIISMGSPTSYAIVNKKKMEEKYVPIFKEALKLHQKWKLILDEVY